MRFWKKRAFALLLASIAAFYITFPVSAGWERNASKQWCYQAPGGERVTGWNYLDKAWYYFNPEGIMQTGWVRDHGKWYYCHQNGSMATGWQKVDGKWYDLNRDGSMRTGWVWYGDSYYYLDAGGAMKTGWLDLNGKRYYLDPSGKMATGERVIEDKAYAFGADGALATAPPIESGEASSVYAEQVLLLVNKEREAAGAAALVPSGSLNGGAEIRAKEIAQGFSHIRPDGTNWNTIFSEINQPTGGTAENLGQNYQTPEDVVSGWMASEGHRENILNPDYNYMGLSVYCDEEGVLWWVQLFAKNLR